MSLRTRFTKTTALATPAILALSGLANQAAGQTYYYPNQPTYQQPTYIQPTVTTPSTTALDLAIGTYNNDLQKLNSSHASGASHDTHRLMTQKALQSIFKYTAKKKFTNPTTGLFDTNHVLVDPKTQDIIQLTLPSGRDLSSTTIPSNISNHTEGGKSLKASVQAIEQELGISHHIQYKKAAQGAANKDKHTEVMTKKESQEFEELMNGKFVGIGTGVGLKNNFIEILNPMDGSPAKNAGLETGDLITHINGESVIGITLQDNIKKIKGPIDSTVSLTIKRKDGTTFVTPITRGTIELDPTEGSRLIGPNGSTALIILSGYTAVSSKYMEKTFNRLHSESIERGNEEINLIFDIRNNGGGSTIETHKIHDALVENTTGTPQIMFRVKGKTIGEQIVYEDSIKPGKWDFKHCIAMIDMNTASSAEIGAAIIQDKGNQKDKENNTIYEVVGRRRGWGKGSMQNYDPVTKTKITVGIFNSGRSDRTTEKYSITPDIKTFSNDRRDQEVENLPFNESGNMHLVDPLKTRASDTPEKTCTLKKEYAGELSDKQIEKMPAELQECIQSYIKAGTTDQIVKMIDIDILTSLRIMYPEAYNEFVTLKDYAPKPKAQAQTTLSFGS